jgi:tetratricopeptide (TPR) repeat protein
MTAQEYFERGKALRIEGRYEEALEAFEQAIQRDGNYANLWNSKGNVYGDLKDYEQALYSYEQAIQRDEKFAYPWNGKGNIYNKLKDYEQALYCFEQAIQRDENLASPWHGKGDAYYVLGDYKQALYCYEQAIRRDENLAGPWHGKGNVCHDLKDYEQALYCYEQAVQRDKNSAIPWHGKGNVFYDLKDYEQALYNYEQAIQRDENLAETWEGKGKVYSDLKDYEQALFCYEQAIQRDEKLTGAWNGKGNVYSALKDYEQALYSYEQAIQRDEKLANPWNGKGNVYNELRDYEQALDCYEQAIRRDENFAPPWYGKGNVYYALKDYEQALYCYEQSIQRDETLASPWGGKGNVYYNLKDYESSKISNIRAFKLEETRPLIYNSLLLFSRYPTAPFYAYRLITSHLPTDQYSEWKLLIETTFGQCRNLQAYTAWLQLSGRQQQVKGWEWEAWRGLVHYFMGDPVASFELLKGEVLPKQPKDLRAWYYLIQSCYGFAEPTEKYMEEALGIAESFVKKQGFLESIGFRKKAVEHKKPDAIQCYYAGRLFLLQEDKTKALNCFEQVKEDFLPAAYMSLLIKEQEEKSTKDVLKYIYQQEKTLANTGQGFACGIPPQRLGLDRNDFWTHFNRFAHYVEISDGIDLFVYEAEKQGLDIGAPMVTSDEQKNFWDVWLLEKEDYRRIFQLAREVRLQRETEKIFRARTRALKREAKQAEFSPEQAEDHIRQQESERLLDAYEKLVGESSAERREQRLGGMISEWALSKPDHYHTLTTALYLQELFTEQQKVMLDFYARIQHYARQNFH